MKKVVVERLSTMRGNKETTPSGVAQMKTLAATLLAIPASSHSSRRSIMPPRNPCTAGFAPHRTGAARGRPLLAARSEPIIPGRHGDMCWSNGNNEFPRRRCPGPVSKARPHCLCWYGVSRTRRWISCASPHPIAASTAAIPPFYRQPVMPTRRRVGMPEGAISNRSRPRIGWSSPCTSAHRRLSSTVA